MTKTSRLTLRLALAAMAGLISAALGAQEQPVKVYILAGQSNMVGIGQFTGGSQGWEEEFSGLELSIYSGSYDASADYDALQSKEVILYENFKAAKKENLPDEGVNVLRGFVEIPETGIYEFKASQGNRSLGWDFLPPGSERFEFTDEAGVTWVHAGYKDTAERWVKGTEPTPIPWYGGKQYDECFDAAQEVLANFDKEFPQWAGRGYEIAGFGWWQGHKDGGQQGKGKAGPLAIRYQQNLAHLIRTLRQEFNAPNAPFVVATCGFEGGEGWEPGSSADTIFKAQMAVGDPAKYPEFAGNVMSVDTRPFYRPPEQSPRNQGFHYHGNAETYMFVGEAMGRAMLRLKE